MKKGILKILVGVILLLVVTSCLKNDEELVNDLVTEDKYVVGHTFDDGKRIHLTFDVPYNGDSLIMAFSNREISLNGFIEKLDYVSELNDGGSKLYKYNKNKKEFGNEDFYIIVCDSFDNDKDVYGSKYRENLGDNCIIKLDKLEGVSLSIKEGTLTRSGATVVITDTSGRDNTYGEFYRIDRKINDEWISLNTVIDNYAFTSIGYKVNEDNKLELDVNWEWLYGKLENGEYRIVKETSSTNHFITAEFIIK